LDKVIANHGNDEPLGLRKDDQARKEAHQDFGLIGHGKVLSGAQSFDYQSENDD